MVSAEHDLPKYNWFNTMVVTGKTCPVRSRIGQVRSPESRVGALGVDSWCDAGKGRGVVLLPPYDSSKLIDTNLIAALPCTFW